MKPDLISVAIDCIRVANAVDGYFAVSLAYDALSRSIKSDDVYASNVARRANAKRSLDSVFAGRPCNALSSVAVCLFERRVDGSDNVRSFK